MIAMLRTPIKKDQNLNTFDFKENRKQEYQEKRKPYWQSNFNTQKCKYERDIINKDPNDSRSIKHDKDIDESKISKSSILPSSKETSLPIISEDIVKLMNNQISGVRMELMTAIERLSTKIENKDIKPQINIDTIDQIINPIDQRAFKTESARRVTAINSMTNTQSDYDIK